MLLSIVNTALTFALLGAILDSTLEQQNLSVSDQSQAETSFGIRIGVGALISLVLYALFIIKMRAGKNWARITLTVLIPLIVLGSLVLSDIGTLLSVGGLGLVKVVLTALELILIIAAVVFMYRPDSNAYFTRAR